MRPRSEKHLAIIALHDIVRTSLFGVINRSSPSHHRLNHRYWALERRVDLNPHSCSSIGRAVEA
jgi:hypothetical protein